MSKNTIAIGKLFNDLLENGYKIRNKGDYELIYPEGLQILTFGNRYVDLVAVSRHKTTKNMIKITSKTENGIVKEVIVTTDHICMVYNRDHFFDNVNAKNLNIGDYVSIYDEKNDAEVIGTIESIIDIGKTEDYVYDCEVDDKLHSFYCEDTLVHNSQFCNISAITDDFKKKYNLCEKIKDWSDEDKLKLWKFMDDFVENDVNKYVQNLITSWCHTERAEVLRYSLEYIADTELMESKKHYACHKVLSEGPEVVDKIKYSGIELKKASIPKKIKAYLGEIYSKTLTGDWKGSDFQSYLNEIHSEFEKLDINDLALWKGYGTARESAGFLQMQKGATGISKACTFYNQLIEKLGIGNKYEAILLGDKVQFCYIKPTNEYGINVIAFKPEQYPDEFRKIFAVDYETMWEKLIESPLKNYLVATGFKYSNPNEANLMEIDDL